MYDNNYRKMIKKILGLSATLGKIEYKIGDDMIGFYKNQVMFGKIEHDKVYFLNSRNKFDQIDLELLEQEDLFKNQAATSRYRITGHR